jgi:hypothetical protein
MLEMKKAFRVFLLTLISITIFNTLEANAQRLLIWGGENHRTFLGCLNGSPYDSESIWNAYGDYGNCYSDKSIWNAYGDYGGAYSSYSPWNAYTSTPPGVYDAKGNFYGYLTRNKANAKRIDTLLTDMMCVFYDMIPDDVSKWYDKLFDELDLGISAK